MGYKEIELNIPTAYSEEQLNQAISKTLRISEFTFQVVNKSLDARKKGNIKWLLRVGVSSPQIKGDAPLPEDSLKLFYKNRNKRVVVTGSGRQVFLQHMFYKNQVLKLL